MIICKCLVCEYEWQYPDGTDIDIVRATCSPCGHQGLFEVREVK